MSSNKVRTTLAIAVEGIEFDTQACMLRIKGRNVEENQYVKVQIANHSIKVLKCFILSSLFSCAFGSLVLFELLVHRFSHPELSDQTQPMYGKIWDCEQFRVLKQVAYYIQPSSSLLLSSSPLSLPPLPLPLPPPPLLSSNLT